MTDTIETVLNATNAEYDMDVYVVRLFGVNAIQMPVAFFVNEDGYGMKGEAGDYLVDDYQCGRVVWKREEFEDFYVKVGGND